MEVTFSPDFFVGNRQKLKALFTGKAPIVITANGLLQRSSDITFPFRQDRNFWYLTGVNEADVIFVSDKSGEYLVLPEGYEHKIRFDGAKTAEDLSKISGIKEVLDYKAGWAKLKTRLKKVKHVATLAASPPYVPFHGFYSNPARASLAELIKKTNDKAELLDISQHLIRQRTVKQEIELEAIKRAIKITEQGIKNIIKKTWSQSATEINIADELLYNFRKLGADDLAFDSVVAVGANASAIHHMPDNTKIQRNNLLLLDVGAEVNQYAADISRVFMVGKPSKRTKQVYAAVQEALNDALAMLKPGIIHKQFEEDMEHVVGEKLRELGLIKTIDRKSVRRYFPTYTSHQLGLDAHDASNYDMPLLKDMVLAVEPGIYIPQEGIGIRIEENVRITDDGIELMSGALPQDLVSLTIK